MAQLTWRDVAAPDFRSSMEGMSQFSQLMNNALTGLQNNLNKWDAGETDAVNTALQLELAKIQDPEAAKAFVANNLAGIDPRRIRADTLQAINARPKEILDLQNTEGDLNWENYTRDLAKDKQGRVDAARPFVNQAIAASLRGEGNTALELMARPEVSALDYSDYSKIVDDSLGVTGKKLDNEGKVITNETGRFDLAKGKDLHSWAKIDRADMQAGMAAAQQVSLSAMTPEDAEAKLSALNLTPGAFNAAKGMLATSFPNLFGTLIPTDAGGIDLSGGTGGPGGADPTRVMNYEARGKGFSVVPESVRTLGQASDFARQVNRAGAESSAMGLYQIVGKTMRGYAEQIWGKDWRNVDFNPQNQDRLAKAIFEDHKGSADALRKQWVSLSPQEAEQIRKLPWEQARQVIARKESGGDPQALFAQARERSGQISGTDAPRTMVSLQGDETSAIDVVNRLKSGVFKGSGSDYLLSQLEGIVNQSKVNGRPTLNYAQAGEIMARSLTRQQTGFERALSFGFGQKNLGNGFRLDDEKIGMAIKEAKAGGYTDRVIEQDEIAASANTVAAAQAAFSKAARDLQQAQQTKLSRPGLDLTKYQARYDAAYAQLEIAKGAAGPKTRPERSGIAPSQRLAAPKSGGNIFDPKTWTSMFTLRN